MKNESNANKQSTQNEGFGSRFGKVCSEYSGRKAKR